MFLVIWEGFCVAWEEEAADLKSLARAEPGRHSFEVETANSKPYDFSFEC